MGRAGIKAVDVITKPVQYAFGKVAEGAGKVGEGIKTGAKFMGRQAAGFGNGTASRFMENTDLKPVANADELIAKRTDLGGQVQEALATKKAALGVTPESLGQEVQSALAKRSEALKETGPVYDAIRKNGENVQVEKNWIDQQIKSATGVDIKNGKITTSGAAKIRDAADVRALQHLYDTWKPVFNRGTMTSNEFLNFRSDAAGLANFERQIGKSQPIENVMKGVRANFNNSYRPQMESLASLDEITSPLYEEIKTLSKGLVDRNGNLSDTGLAKVVKATTDKPQLLAQLEKVSPGITEKIAALQEFNELGKGIIDENGNITDAGMKKITNAANESNPQMLARLEQIKPGITGLIKDFKALQDVENARGSKVGTYTRSAIGGGGFVAGLMTMNPIMVGSAIAEMILTSPENAVKIIQTYAKTKPIMDAVVSKLKAGVKGTLNDINNLPNNPGQSFANMRARLPEKIPMRASIEDVSGGKPGYSEGMGQLFGRKGGMFGENTSESPSIIKYPTGKYGFAGNIPDELTEPSTTGSYAAAKTRSKIFDSKEEAQSALDSYKAQSTKLKPGAFSPKAQGEVETPKTTNPLIYEAKKYASAEEFVKGKTPVYHGSKVPLKSFSNKKGGVFFTDEYADATGFGGSPDNVYEGYLNFKKPLVIDAKGAKWDELNTKYGSSTQEVISNAQKDGFDGVTFKNIVDNIGDTADWGGTSTIHYAYKPKDAFLNESQLTDIWNKAHGKTNLGR
jgi:hypothetical protein